MLEHEQKNVWKMIGMRIRRELESVRSVLWDMCSILSFQN